MIFVIIISAIIFFCVLKSLRLVVAILETAAEFVEEVTTALYIPPAIFIVLTLFYGYWMTIAIYLYSSGT